MTKRKLSKRQHRRVHQQHSDSIARAENQEALESESLGPEQKGRVIARYGNQADIEPSCTEAGNSAPQKIRCHLRANVKSVVAGDRIIWRQGKDSGVIVSQEPRTSELTRPDSYGNLRIVAANVDQLLITIAPQPLPHANLIDRYITAAEISGIKPIILLNKSDLLDGEEREDLEQIRQLYSQLGYPLIETSAKQERGLDQLIEILQHKTSIFVGQSGVGKSSIIKALLPEEEIRVGALSEAMAKGKHTTTHSQLFHFIHGGECIDSPGIREFGLWHFNAEEIMQGFIELRDLAGNCKFRDCSHQREPGCAILDALASRSISQLRYDSYLHIINTLNDVEIKSKHKG